MSGMLVLVNGYRGGFWKKVKTDTTNEKGLPVFHGKWMELLPHTDCAGEGKGALI